MAEVETPFWRRPLAELDHAQWESLCDGCGRCCLVKLEDEDGGELCYTAVACRCLDLERCRCTDYARRAERVPECVQVSAANAAAVHWMPRTCAYRLLAEGSDLPPWHPLRSGDPDSVHAAGVSVRHFAVSEAQLDEDDDLEDFIVDGME